MLCRATSSDGDEIIIDSDRFEEIKQKDGIDEIADDFGLSNMKGMRGGLNVKLGNCPYGSKDIYATHYDNEYAYGVCVCGPTLFRFAYKKVENEKLNDINRDIEKLKEPEILKKKYD